MMVKIDTNTWKPFRVGDLFEAKRGKSRIMRELNDGDVPLIAAARAEQGVAGTFDIESEYADAITVSCNGAGCGSTFYHSGAFAITGDASVLLEKSSMSQLVKMFITSILDGRLSHIYSYAEKCGPAVLSDEVILLPATPDGEPDWAYMEAYMQQVMDREEMFAEHLASLTAEAVADGHVVDTSAWKAFKVGDLFEVFNGKKYVTHTRVPGPLPLISNSAVDNGIGDFIAARLDNVWSNFISVAYGSGTGIAFYHEKAAFVGETVMALVPRFDMTSNVGLFIAAVLTRYGVETYKYERKPKVDEYRSKVSIELPATPDGAPDWAYMEQYMRDVMAVEALFADELDRLSRE